MIVSLSPEKAEVVGGSTPSLATTFLPMCRVAHKNLAESRLALLVRSQSAIFWRDPVRFLHFAEPARPLSTFLDHIHAEKELVSGIFVVVSLAIPRVIRSEVQDGT
jgi:hypothetical protein